MKSKAKKPSNAEEELFFKIITLYKRKCDLSGLIVDPTIRQILNNAFDKCKLDTINLHESIGPIHTRALF